MKAEIYSKDNCVFCTKAKMLLNNREVEYREFIVSPGFDEEKVSETQQYVTKEQLLERVPHAKTLPQIWLDGIYVGGYTELAAFFNNK